jgi:maltose/moltooligosaccharide transporter
MEPFRAFVGDKLSEKQQSFGYAMQSMFIGGASFIAGFLPMLLNRYFGINNESVNNSIPDNIRWSFYIGAFAFFLSVLYTVMRADEYPPDEKELDKLRAQKISPMDIVKEIFQGIINMPSNMKRLALVQFLTWPGLFLMWFYYTPSVANYIFKATSTSDPNYTSGVEFANMTYSIENLVTFLFSFTLPFWVGFLGKRNTHIVCLFIGALGLFSFQYVHNPNYLFLTMGMVGIAWASILSMPYSLLAGTLPPQKMGFYMGVFNFFIVIPEILASLFFGWILKNWLDNNMMLGVVTGGILMALAALACFFVKENVPQFQEEESKISH